ncbi:CBS domain-containing protein [Acidobacteria bacterium AH-259-O06]|nr:CBS domain-containing protein [Acidobacteria bacterium AH-259-O06]
MKVIKVAQVPPPTVCAEASVLEAVHIMEQVRVGASAVLDGDQLVGIFSERDVMLRVVSTQRDPEKTAVREVMTTVLETIQTESDTSEALELMVSRHIRHLPVVAEDGTLAGLLSLRNLLQYHVEALVDQLNSLEAYFTADGPGG